MARAITPLLEAGQRVPRIKDLARLAGKVAKAEGLAGRINLIFCDDSTIRSLNREYRGLDKVTDVLSFFWGEPEIAGEIFIAPNKAKSQCKMFNNSYFNELRRLVVHGVLHLSGFDHLKPKERKIMREREDFHLVLAKSNKK